MTIGRRIHEEKFTELYETYIIPVSTPEDHWGVRLLGIIHGIIDLDCRGITRELAVFGKYQGYWFLGCIDELLLDRNTLQISICDLKTRTFDSLPKTRSTNPAAIQLMLYHKLLCQMSLTLVNIDEVANGFGLDISRPFSPDLITALHDDPSYARLLNGTTNLAKLWPKYTEQVMKLMGRIDSLLKIVRVGYFNERFFF